VLGGLDRVGDAEPGNQTEAGERQDLQADHDGLLGRRAELVAEALQADEVRALVGDRAAQKGDRDQQVPADFLGPSQGGAGVTEDHLGE